MLIQFYLISRIPGSVKPLKNNIRNNPLKAHLYPCDYLLYESDVVRTGLNWEGRLSSRPLTNEIHGGFRRGRQVSAAAPSQAKPASYVRLRDLGAVRLPQACRLRQHPWIRYRVPPKLPLL